MRVFFHAFVAGGVLTLVALDLSAGKAPWFGAIIGIANFVTGILYARRPS